ncbi:MAG: alkaline phosphatase [Pseudomonadota bacterium]
MRLTASLALFVFAAACATTPGHDTAARADTALIIDAPSPADLGRAVASPRQAGEPYYEAAKAAVDARAEARGVLPAKNVILFIGDGMGVSTITAGRIYAGQKRGLDGESYKLAMETLPWGGLSKTYSHDFQTADSAATATAMVAGLKTNSGIVGLTKAVGRGRCDAVPGQGTDSLFELAERNGLATGVVSTARLTHATPASVYGESADRGWEDDTAIPDGADCKDLAAQLIDWPEGDGLEVALGGGRRHFLPVDVADPEDDGATGNRRDGRNLVAEWEAKSADHKMIFDQAGFDAVDFKTQRVLGLFERSHMEYEYDRLEDKAGEPSLAEMTKAAITRLSQDEDGFVLMVEGGRIDHAHHGGNAARALEDLDAFDLAVKAAIEMTDADETLILVTADHSHTLVIQGYQIRNNPILGKAQISPGTPARAADGKPFTTLSYANGPGAVCVAPSKDKPCVRPDLSDVDTTFRDFRQQALLPSPSETHAGEDVAVFAGGPGAELVGGVIEQHEIFHILAKAAGLIE